MARKNPRPTTFAISSFIVSSVGIGFSCSAALRREIQGNGARILLALPGWTRTEMVPENLIDILHARGFILDDPDEVAEQIVDGLIQGTEELIMGGPMAKLGIIAERYFPIGHHIYGRFMLNQTWIDATKHIP